MPAARPASPSFGAVRAVPFALTFALAVACTTPLAAQGRGRAVDVTGSINLEQPGAVIAPELYGQFAEHLGRGIYDGVWVGPDSPIPNTRGFRNDVVAALRAIHVPVIRWPGGCFADDYHWRDGIGPRAKRPVRVNVLWGGVEESNAVGTHEYFDLVEQVGAKSYVAGNVGTGSPLEMGQWLEYLTSPTRSTLATERRTNGREAPFRVDYFGVGNENWGCGGSMTAEHYADQYRNFAEFVRSPQQPPIVRVASGPNAADYKWTEVLMERARDQMDALSLHYYTITTGNWDAKGSATNFDETLWMETLVQARRMEEIVARHATIMDRYDPKKRVALYADEWGVWHDVEPGTNPGFLYQQNSLRDAMVAALTLNIFHAHADRVRLAAIAQMVNVLQSLVLTQGGQMVLTPTYHVFDLYQVFQGATALPIAADASPYTLGARSIPRVSATAARGRDGAVHVALVNADPNVAVAAALQLQGSAGRRVTGRILTAPTITAHNTFTAPSTVAPTAFTEASVANGVLRATLPPRSIVVLSIRE